MNPKYPVYIISKGRWVSRLTSKALEEMRVPYNIVVEPQEYENYAAVIDPKKILVLPFSNLGQGGIPARNWVWEHSVGIGAERHWILDDNIAWFARIYMNKEIRISSGICFYVTEEFVDRYTNIAIAGLQYEMFLIALQKQKPLLLNTRVYSCILIRNDIPYRWRGKYNEDTDLSIRVLKDGWCTLMMQHFMCKKMATMRMGGGNTVELYQQNEHFDGRLEMAKSLQRQHPDVVQIKRRWGRWQHVVDYRKFKYNKLIRKPDIEIPKGINNYGMKLMRIDEVVK